MCYYDAVCSIMRLVGPSVLITMSHVLIEHNTKSCIFNIPKNTQNTLVVNSSD